jgi:hypothetical protein
MILGTLLCMYAIARENSNAISTYTERTRCCSLRHASVMELHGSSEWPCMNSFHSRTSASAAMCRGMPLFRDTRMHASACHALALATGLLHSTCTTCTSAWHEGRAHIVVAACMRSMGGALRHGCVGGGLLWLWLLLRHATSGSNAEHRP